MNSKPPCSCLAKIFSIAYAAMNRLPRVCTERAFFSIAYAAMNEYLDPLGNL